MQRAEAPAEAGAEAEERFGAPVPAGLTRRDVTVDAGAIPTAPGTRLRVGEALLEVLEEDPLNP